MQSLTKIRNTDTFDLKKKYKIRTLKFRGLISSGDVLSVFLYFPFFRKFSKKILKKYQLNWNLKGSGNVFTLKKKFSKQVFLCNFSCKVFMKYWRFSSFVCLIKFSNLKHYLRLVSGFFKIKKVIISLFFYLSAHNVVSSFCVNKNINFRRKNLNYLLLKFSKKINRLYPIRRMHKKKKKNR